MNDGRVCAIHQPNLFPRWVTLAKLLASTTWVVLDDVQFCRHDYQHRARLGQPDAAQRQWLVVPVHLPHGRGTAIRDVRVADPETARRRVARLTRQYYRRAPGWARIAAVVDEVADLIGSTESLATVAETSTTLLLRACGWTGEIVRSSVLARQGPISTERSARLADLTRAAGCPTYLCGRSGRAYLHPRPFTRTATTVEFFALPDADQGPLVDLTALTTLAARTVPSA
ncbi:WbqC family protein [Pseudonocardia nigra]|uniref:WbqC family protein n=1 Tax=Pseudonocardia nigra TaxID=1921578 RepID=UPI001C5FA4AE|nr:WbqC family protein [Pseudonocardia nigra]